MSIRFDGRVAIVTGAGGGLGRCHALGLAERGARVVVNDVGGARDGRGRSTEAAERVVAEIREAGGEALANGADVASYEEVEAMVAAAMSAWGRVDVLVNNAGILRDRTLLKVDLGDFRRVLDVHLMGSVHCTKAVWGIMREQGYGRVVMTTSSTGLWGNFGQTNYGSAKMALVGLMNTLALEGAKYDIRVNCLSPSAATRMTAELMPEELLRLLSPKTVTPGLLYLVSEDAPNRVVLTAGAGAFAAVILYETEGVWLGADELTPEGVAEHWRRILDPAGQVSLRNGHQQTERFLRRAAAGWGIYLEAGGEGGGAGSG